MDEGFSGRSVKVWRFRTCGRAITDENTSTRVAVHDAPEKINQKRWQGFSGGVSLVPVIGLK